MSNQTALSRQWLIVVIVSPIPCNNTAAVIERHCGCTPLHIVKCVLFSSTVRIRVFPSRLRLLSHMLLSLFVSPSATSRNRLSNLASPVSLISCLVRRSNFCARATEALARDRKHEENKKSQLAKYSLSRVTTKCLINIIVSRAFSNLESRLLWKIWCKSKQLKETGRIHAEI